MQSSNTKKLQNYQTTKLPNHIKTTKLQNWQISKTKSSNNTKLQSYVNYRTTKLKKNNEGWEREGWEREGEEGSGWRVKTVEDEQKQTGRPATRASGEKGSIKKLLLLVVVLFVVVVTHSAIRIAQVIARLKYFYIIRIL